MWFEQNGPACLQTVSDNGQIKSTGSTPQWQKNVLHHLHHHHHHGHYQHYHHHHHHNHHHYRYLYIL